MTGRRNLLRAAFRLGAGGAGCAWLSGCGFHPLYATRRGGAAGPAAAGLAAVHVDIIPERIGQLTREDLQALLDGGTATVAKHYDLQVVLGFATEGENILPDNSASRVRYTATASYTLRDQTPARTVLVSGTVRQIDAANVIDNQYFALDLETETVIRRLANGVANQIALRLGIYFDVHPPA